MKNIAYFLFILLFVSCNSEQKHLQVLQTMADNPRFSGTEERPVLGLYYLKHFSDNKQCLKELLEYIKDSISVQAPFECYNIASIAKKKTTVKFEGGEGYFDSDYLGCSFYEKGLPFFVFFHTWSDFYIWMPYYSDFPNKCTYKYTLEKVNGEYLVSFNYKLFNTDEWQKFLNIVFYEREAVEYKPVEEYKNSPARYVLVNPVTHQRECIIEFSYIGKDRVFTLDII